DIGAARIVLYLEDGPIHFVQRTQFRPERVRIRAHRTELVHSELPSSQTATSLAIEHGSGRRQLDEQRQCQQNRGEYDQQCESHQEVHHTLCQQQIIVFRRGGKGEQGHLTQAFKRDL